MGSTTIRLDGKSLSGLLGDAYDAGLNPSSWRHFAAESARACDAQLAIVEYQDENDSRRSFLAAGGLNGFEEIFAAHRSRSGDDNYLLAIRGQPAGTVRLGSEVVPREAMRKSRTYSQLARPWDLEHFLFGAIESGTGVNAFFSLCRTAGEDPFVPGDKALISQLLLAHLGRGLALQRSLDVARSGNALLSGVLDLARYGIVVFDPRGRPILRNQAADTLLAAGDGLTLKNGNLQTTDPATQSRLNDALEAGQQAALGWSVAPPAPVLVGRRANHSPYRVIFSPLSLRGDRSGLPSGSAVLAVIHAGRHGNPPALPPELKAAYGLSRAEVALCAALLEGKSLLEAANALDIVRNTAKTHLARIFDKTGVRSQAALLRLLAFGARNQVNNP